jgi:hypothetical protein
MIIALVEGKDWQRLLNGREAFPTRWENEGYMKTVELLLNMMEPIHWMGTVVMGDSGFCVAEGGMVLDDKGVYGQFLIKKRRYWPKHVPGEHIDGHMVGKRLGETNTYDVHCCHDAD